MKLIEIKFPHGDLPNNPRHRPQEKQPVAAAWSTQQTPMFEADLLRRYDTVGPRYTSYPTANQFDDSFDSHEYEAITRASNTAPEPPPLSLYFHIPFCDTVCFYCACNKIVTANHGHAGPYLDHLCREVALHGALIDPERRVDQLHWGGGTPTFLDRSQMQQLMRCTREHFNLHDDDDGEYSVEIDPRRADADAVALLRELGFNRMSIGLQDFDERVQKAVNRVQSEQQVWTVVEAARNAGFQSMNADLIYGLPLQSVESFAQTLDKVIAIDPDRLSIFNYAHLPQRFKTQRQIKERDLPSAEEKLSILAMTVERLVDNGYVYIGMDHFAKPEDELATAQRSGTLCRNFQGYSTHADCDLVGMGVTGISAVGNSYCQNVRRLDQYYPEIDSGRIPILRGLKLSADDRLRREIIMSLVCNGYLAMQSIENQYGIRFLRHFKKELHELEAMERDGLLRIDTDTIEVLPPGKLLIRRICMAFDRYLDEPNSEPRYSRVI